MLQIENIPAWLRENGRFLLWRYCDKDGRKTKEPLNRYGYLTDPIGRQLDTVRSGMSGGVPRHTVR